MRNCQHYVDCNKCFIKIEYKSKRAADCARQVGRLCKVCKSSERNRAIAAKNSIPGESCIYVIINLLDNKKYLGSTINMKQRKNGHLTSLRRGKHENMYLQRSFDKYGIDSFKFQIIEHCEKSACLSLEQEYLNEIFSFEDHKTRYYNINPYAIRPPIMSGKDNPNYGKDFSAETRLKMSLAKKDITAGEGNNFFGKKHSDETRIKMKAAHNVLPIYAINIITQEKRIFANAREAAEYLDIDMSCICHRINKESLKYTNRLVNKEWKIYR